MTYYTPIWDVLVPEGKQEEVGEHFSTCSRCPGFPIRQAVSGVSLCGLGSLLGSLAMVFIKYVVHICSYNICTLIICVWGGRNGWMAVNGFG